MTTVTMASPVGCLTIQATEDGTLQSINYADESAEVSPAQELAGHPVVEQLEAYFAGERSDFDIPYAFVGGTEFQRQVWRQIEEIPFGETISYGDIARAVGRPGASRAVGAACGQNPISIVVPCHRVVGSSGKLTGYGGGLDRKVWLLAFEKQQQPLIP